ncbi:MAG: hypothetical protein JHC84_21170 [Solirubrobacteraceae bacterium]|nr:hypothetical protein [Solirubrobacteraceae bacterium]
MTGSVVRLPPHVRPPLDVYINGVPQQEGTDYDLRDDALHFTRSLKHEGKLGAWRWFLGAWGIGTYREHHAVDVRYTLDGRPMVAEGLVPEDEPTAG